VRLISYCELQNHQPTDGRRVFANQMFLLEIRARRITVVLAGFNLENETIISASWASRVRDFQVQISELKEQCIGKSVIAEREVVSARQLVMEFN
jgi:hypothetical protein